MCCFMRGVFFYGLMKKDESAHELFYIFSASCIVKKSIILRREKARARDEKMSQKTEEKSSCSG
ncbi:MAG: hypothetical protein D3908_16095 [Candidatus Electrothrix sp. AUS4]|nr:hypothetical protein [Candidatus Electrothrix sp. AUS4]